MDLEVQADEMSSCTTAAAASFGAGFCWGPSSWGSLESLVSAGVGVRCRGIVGCFLFKCLVRFLVAPPVQLITKEQYQHLPFPGSDEEKCYQRSLFFLIMVNKSVQK
jgi:hypothetical protein